MFLKWINENQALIEFLGLILVIPLAIVSDQIVTFFDQRKNKKNLSLLLIHELWINLNFVSQIEQSHESNRTDKKVHIPYFPPRTSVLSKFLSYDLLTSLPKKDQEGVTEVYAQLTELKYEYNEWRNLLTQTTIMENKENYELRSQFVLNYISPLMKNMIDLFIRFLLRYGQKADDTRLRDLNKSITTAIQNGKWIGTTYKSSLFNPAIQEKEISVLVCWVDNMPKNTKSNIEIIELANSIPIHDSWKKDQNTEIQ